MKDNQINGRGSRGLLDTWSRVVVVRPNEGSPMLFCFVFSSRLAEGMNARSIWVLRRHERESNKHKVIEGKALDTGSSVKIIWLNGM